MSSDWFSRIRKRCEIRRLDLHRFFVKNELNKYIKYDVHKGGHGKNAVWMH